jgi:hypothetical protein
LGAATLIGLALGAGKLAASLSLLSNFPRDVYPLPGVEGFASVIYVALRSLFTPVTDALGHLVVHSRLRQEQHEFEYGVSLGPPLLMLAAAWHAARGGWRPRFSWGGCALVALLLVPLVLNLYVPVWNGFLKSLPYFGSSSTLLRWFAAYILPVILAGAWALDALSAGHPLRARALAGGGVALMLLTTAFSNHDKYDYPDPRFAAPGSAMLGFYDQDALAAAWHKARDTGVVPPISAITVFHDQNNEVTMAPVAQNGLTEGYSTLFCYEPLFGYHLEKLPFGKIRVGDVLSARDGILNIKNPACYVFPDANQCRPGDQFTQDQRAQAQAFVNYMPYPFKKPWYATLADWLNLAALAGVPAALGWACWRLRRRAS